MIDTLDNDVETVTSCVYTHTFADKSVYVGAAKTLGKRDQSFEARNETYAKKLEQFGSPTISIVNTFDTTDGDYTEVALHEREVYDLLKDMDVEMVNGSAPLGVPSPWWIDNPSTKRIENGTHNFLTNHPNIKRIENGTHNWVDYTIYTFECFKGPDTGATFTGMRSDLLKAYPYINKGNMNTHIRGVGCLNGANGWRLAKQ